jgi:hypothetical protein
MPDKRQILSAIRNLAEKLGHPPSRAEFLSRTGLPFTAVLRWFPSWTAALRDAGFRSYAIKPRFDDHLLLEDWGRVVRRHGAVPPRRVYDRLGKFNALTLSSRFGNYSSIPQAFRNFAKDHRHWDDVVALLSFRLHTRRENRHPHPRSKPTTPASFASLLRPKPWHAEQPGQPTFGNPTPLPGFLHEPLNEQGVVLLFGMVAKDLGFLIESVQTGFPDCEAKRQIGPGRWQRVRIEFEYESKSFLTHGHSADRCDLIVCWCHNWPNHPKHLQILALSQAVKLFSS